MQIKKKFSKKQTSTTKPPISHSHSNTRNPLSHLPFYPPPYQSQYISPIPRHPVKPPLSTRALTISNTDTQHNGMSRFPFVRRRTIQYGFLIAFTLLDSNLLTLYLSFSISIILCSYSNFDNFNSRPFNNSRTNSHSILHNNHSIKTNVGNNRKRRQRRLQRSRRNTQPYRRS